MKVLFFAISIIAMVVSIYYCAIKDIYHQTLFTGIGIIFMIIYVGAEITDVITDKK